MESYQHPGARHEPRDQAARGQSGGLQVTHGILVETNLKPFVSLQSKNVSVDNEVKSHLDLVLYFG